MRLYWPAKLRPAFDALLDIDGALADVVARSTEPALGAIKLAWWRERLEELDRGVVPAEPRLQAAARELLPRGIRGQELAGLVDDWTGLLDEAPELAPDCGERLFRLGARLLGVEFEDQTVGQAARLFARARAARRTILAMAPMGTAQLPKMPRRSRPLTALGALAARDLRLGGPPFEPEATPGRAWTLLRHRVSGRL
ncbi:MAG TPA: hypothetical protein VFK58_04660 [Sphingomicrobium sp.]|nr:hypothetical protein [Sphingomicrobium sp.]